MAWEASQLKRDLLAHTDQSTWQLLPKLHGAFSVIWVLLCVLLAGASLYSLLQVKELRTNAANWRVLDQQIESLLLDSQGLRHLDYLHHLPNLQTRLKQSGYANATELIEKLHTEIANINEFDQGYGLDDWTDQLTKLLERITLAHNNWSSSAPFLPQQYENTVPGLLDEWFATLRGLSQFSTQLSRAHDEKITQMQHNNLLLALAVLGFSLALVGLNRWQNSLASARYIIEVNSLHDEVRKDPLTQLLNRRGWTELTQLQIRQLSRFGFTPMAVAVLDIDYFKQYNDLHGHDAGDRRLVEFARVLKHNFRPCDVLARVGGEEFAVLLPNCTVEDAQRIIDRIRSNNSRNIPFSAGIASLEETKTVERALLVADEALYTAKQTGRNRSCIGKVGAELGAEV